MGDGEMAPETPCDTYFLEHSCPTVYYYVILIYASYFSQYLVSALFLYGTRVSNELDRKGNFLKQICY